MDFNQYQALAQRTIPQGIDTLAHAAMGIAGEAGEVVDVVKKVRYQGHDLDTEAISKLVDEAGDVLWGLAELATALGVPLETIAAQNIAKLQARYKGPGFSADESRNR